MPLEIDFGQSGDGGEGGQPTGFGHEIPITPGGGPPSPLQEALARLLDAVIEARLAAIEAELEGVATTAIQSALNEAEQVLIGLRDAAQDAADSITNMQVATGEPGTPASWDGTTLTVPRGMDGAASLPIGAPGQYLGYGTGGVPAAMDAPVATWDSLTGKPVSYPPTLHRHGWTDLDGVPAAFPPSAHSHAWPDITSRPSAFPPAAHGHAVADVTGLQAALDGKAATAHGHAWADVTGKPAEFPPTPHSHAWDAITDKPATFAPATHRHDASEIDNLPTGGGGGGSTAWADVTGKPTEFPPSAHGHGWGEITDKPATFAPSAHSHAWADVTGKPTIIAAGADQAAARAVIGAGTSSLVLGTTSGTAKAGDWLPAWSDVSGKPSTFPPSAHSHSWDDVTGKPVEFPPSAHSHSWADVTGKPAVIAAGADQAAARAAIGAGTSSLAIGTTASTAKAGNYAPTWAQVTSKPTTFAPAAHAHAIVDVTGLQGELDGKAASAHSHAWDAITDKPGFIAAGATAAAARTAIGLGTASTQATGAFATAAQGALADTAVQPAAMQSYTAPVVVLTQAAYDALSPPVAGTVYVVTA